MRKPCTYFSDELPVSQLSCYKSDINQLSSAAVADIGRNLEELGRAGLGSWIERNAKIILGSILNFD